MTFMACLHSEWYQNRSSEMLVSTAAVETSPLQGEQLLKVLIFQNVIPHQTFHLDCGFDPGQQQTLARL